MHRALCGDESAKEHVRAGDWVIAVMDELPSPWPQLQQPHRLASVANGARVEA